MIHPRIDKYPALLLMSSHWLQALRRPTPLRLVRAAAADSISDEAALLLAFFSAQGRRRCKMMKCSSDPAF